MALKTPRQSRWIWRSIGVLQIANAVAFGAVVMYGDFTKEARAKVFATAEEDASDEVTSEGETPIDEPSATQLTSAELTGPMPTFSIEPASPLADPRPSSYPASPPNTLVRDSIVSSILPPTLSNPATNSVAIRFIVNGERVELKPGERRRLSGGDSWVVRFHRGGKYGAALQPIYDGEHQFVIGSQGWSLERADGTPN